MNAKKDIFKKTNKFFNYSCFIVLSIFTVIIFFQSDIVRVNYLKDIPSIVKYNKIRFNISNIYKNAIFYGVNIKFIIYEIIFNIFTFIPMGCILANQKLSKRQSFVKFLIISLIYEMGKALMHISEFGIDTFLLHFSGLYLGYMITISFISKENRFLQKSVLLIIFCMISFEIFNFRLVYELFIANLDYVTEEHFLTEEAIWDESTKLTWGNYYDPYKKHLNELDLYTNIKGKFEGLSVKNDKLSIKIDNQVYTFNFNEESIFIDKQVHDYDHNKIEPLARKDVFEKNLSDKKAIRLQEIIAMRVNSNAEAEVVIDENNTIKSICIVSEFYKNGVNKF